MAKGSDGEGGVRRRDLFKSAGAAAAASAFLNPLRAFGQEAGGGTGTPSVGPGPVEIALDVNGGERKLAVEPRRTLLDALRGDMDLTGAKRVCDRGTCGACTVWMNGKPVYSCMVLAVEAEGSEITTVEGLGTPDNMHAVQAAFVAEDALQCGFCTPGFVMSCAWAVKEHGTELTDETLRESVCGNLCRCGTYTHVVAAALSAARAAEGE